MSKNRLEQRRIVEAAERMEQDGTKTTKRKTTKRKTTKRKTTTRKTKERGVQRKRLVWCVFNGSMKEEGRFPYDQKEAAEAKLELLRSKSKKMYFIQPVKEVIGDAAPIVPESSPIEVDDDLEEVTKSSAKDDDGDDEPLDEDDVSAEDFGDDDSDDDEDGDDDED